MNLTAMLLAWFFISSMSVKLTFHTSCWMRASSVRALRGDHNQRAQVIAWRPQPTRTSQCVAATTNARKSVRGGPNQRAQVSAWQQQPTRASQCEATTTNARMAT